MTPYRFGPRAAGLPFPRRGLALFSALGFAAACAGIVVLPLCGGLTLGGPSAFFRHLREGGAATYLLVVLHVCAPLVLATYGALMLRGRVRSASSLLGAGMLVPVALALVAAALASRRVAAALAAGGIDTDAAQRLVVVAMRENAFTIVFGEIASTACAAVLLVVMCGAVVSIDVDRVASGRAGFAWNGSRFVVGIGAAWLLVDVLVLATVGRDRALTPLAFAPTLWIPFATVLAAFAARGATCLPAWHDVIDARRHAGALLVAGVSAVAVPCLLESAIVGHAETLLLMELSGESLEPSAKFRVVTLLVPASTHANVALAVHGGFGLVMFGVVLARVVDPLARLRSIGRVVRHGAGALIATVIVVGAARGTAAQRDGLVAQVAVSSTKLAPADLRLPTVPAATPDGVSRGRGVVIHADGRRTPAGRPPFGSYDAIADARLPVSQLLGESVTGRAAGREPSTVTLVARAASRERFKPDVGPYDAIVVSDVRNLSFVAPVGSWPARGPVIEAHISSQELVVELGDGALHRIPLTPARLGPALTPWQLWAPSLPPIRLSVRPDVTVELLATVLAVLSGGYGEQLPLQVGPHECAIVVEPPSDPARPTTP